MRKFLQITMTISTLALLVSCTSDFQGYGVVNSEKKLGGINYTPKTSTAVGVLGGAGTGFLVGATAGAVSGEIAGVACAVPTLGTSMVIFPVVMLVPCGIAGSIVGGIVGGGGGYVYGINEQGIGVYKLKINKLDNKNTAMIFNQNLEEKYPPGTVVKIFKDTQMLYPKGYHIQKATTEETIKLQKKIYPNPGQ